MPRRCFYCEEIPKHERVKIRNLGYHEHLCSICYGLFRKQWNERFSGNEFNYLIVFTKKELESEKG